MSEFTFVQLSTKPPQWTIMQADGERETSIGGVQFDEGWLSVWVEGAHELEGLRHVQVPLETTFDDILRLALEAVQEWDAPKQTPEVRLRCSIDPLMIEPPEGMAYKWVVRYVKDDPQSCFKRHDDYDDALASGWRIVPKDRHPEEIRGCVLMERPKAEADAAIAELTIDASDRFRQLMLAFMSGALLKHDLPPGFTVLSTAEVAADRALIATPRGWVTAEHYRAAERADGTNPLDDD